MPCILVHVHLIQNMYWIVNHFGEYILNNKHVLFLNLFLFLSPNPPPPSPAPSHDVSVYVSVCLSICRCLLKHIYSGLKFVSFTQWNWFSLSGCSVEKISRILRSVILPNFIFIILCYFCIKFIWPAFKFMNMNNKKMTK